MRIGILTFHNAYNCGAMLQAWALCVVLKRMGHAVAFPNCNSVGKEPRFKWLRSQRSGLARVRTWGASLLAFVLSVGACDVTRWLFKRFQRRMLPLCLCPKSDMSRRFDCLVVGSDQVWNEALIGDEVSLFLGEGLPHEMPLLGYAVSMGDKAPSEALLARVLRAIARFEFVSLREAYARDFLKDVRLASAIPVVLDPTLLLVAEDYEQVYPTRRVKDDYLYVYAGPPTQAIVRLASKMAQRLNLRLVVTPVYQYSRLGAVPGLRYDIAPDLLCAYMKFAKAAVVASFHGTAFALQYRVPFVNVGNAKSGRMGRPLALLSALGEAWRQVSPDIPEDECLERLSTPIKASAVERLAALRQESLDCLKGALTKAEARMSHTGVADRGNI